MQRPYHNRVTAPAQAEQPQRMKVIHALLTCTACAMALSAQPAWSQGSGSTGGSGSGGAAVMKSDTTAASKLNEADREMMADLIHNNYAEIETGKMALEKSQNTQVKNFAQRMIDDHQQMSKDLQQLAKTKGLTLPQGTDLQHKALSTALGVLNGDAFNSQYIRRVGIGDHERTIELLKKAQTQAQDPDIKAMAQKSLPKIQEHLSMARKIEASLSASEKSGSRGSQGSNAGAAAGPGAGGTAGATR
jgi:putative membrane protein